MATSGNEVLSWTSQDPRQSQLFGSYGVLYRFQVRLPDIWSTTLHVLGADAPCTDGHEQPGPECNDTVASDPRE